MRKIIPLEPKDIITVLFSLLQELFSSENHSFAKIYVLSCVVVFNVKQIGSRYTRVFNSNNMKIYWTGGQLDSIFMQNSYLLDRLRSTCKRARPTYYPQPPMEFPFGEIVALNVM